VAVAVSVEDVVAVEGGALEETEEVAEASVATEMVAVEASVGTEMEVVEVDSVEGEEEEEEEVVVVAGDLIAVEVISATTAVVLAIGRGIAPINCLHVESIFIFSSFL